MGKVHSFKESKSNVGDVGEEVIIKYLKQQKDVAEVECVRDSKEHREKDIDIILTRKDGSVETIEIKTDSYKSGNLFYETYSCIETGSIGCLEKTEANYIYYYFIKTRELYVLKTDSFRRWFNINKPIFPEKQIKNKRYNGGTYTSIGHTIPKSILERSFRKHKKLYI